MNIKEIAKKCTDLAYDIDPYGVYDCYDYDNIEKILNAMTKDTIKYLKAKDVCMLDWLNDYIGIDDQELHNRIISLMNEIKKIYGINC